MRRLLNTMYVTSPDSYLRRDGTNVVVEVDGKEVGRIPIHNIEQIMMFGRPGASPGVMSLCADNGVTLTFLKPNGRFLASVHGEVKGNVLLRRQQYRMADDEETSLKIARNMIDGKLINCRAVLRKGLSNHSDRIDEKMMSLALDSMTRNIAEIKDVTTIQELRGKEGDAARMYFQAIDSLILRDKQAFFMDGRTRRPPKDRFNSLLSFLYSMLLNDVRSALESVGLDPYVGFMHTDRPGRPSLALDLMEELRPIADRTALRLVNLGMVNRDGFIEEEGGSFRLNEDARATVIAEWQRLKTVEIRHPFLEETIQMGLVPFVQSMMLAKFVRNDLDGYPPFVMRRRE